MHKFLVLAGVMFILWFSSVVSVSAQEMTKASKIMDAQRYLYAYGYGDDEIFPNGTIDKNTREMIRQYERERDLPVTGLLTRDLYNQLKTDGFPYDWYWAAVAASPDGVYSSGTRFLMRKDAIQSVLKDCRARSTIPGKCHAVSVSNNGWVPPRWATVLYCQKTIPNQTVRRIFFSIRDSKNAVVRAAFAISASEFAPSQCSLLKVVVADFPE